MELREKRPNLQSSKPPLPKMADDAPTFDFDEFEKFVNNLLVEIMEIKKAEVLTLNPKP